MPARPDDPVEDLITRAVQELEQRGEPGLQEFLTRHATHAGAVREGLERLRRLGILAPPPAAPAERSQYGEFRVLRRIGAGGMGVVYAAEQTSLQRTVALKVVRPEFLLSTTARERFQREVEAIARLQHPGIVPILAVGNDDTQPWFAMEFVEGRPLDELVTALQGKDPSRIDGAIWRSHFGVAPGSGGSALFAGSHQEACVRIVQQVATTMAYVHERGIVHRDLKPSNIVLTPQGQALLLDFGLAHVRDLHRVTRDERPLGSPGYVSPEQVRGEAIDERIDVYGLGVTLYELLTTHLPFEQDTWETLQQAIVTGGAEPVRAWNRAVTRDLEIVCMVAMDRDRSRRYRSMADFAADLDAVLARRPILARPLGPGLRLLRFAQRHPTWAIAAVALLLLALQFPLVLWRQQASANAELAKLNDDLQHSNQNLDRQRRVALDHYNDAIDAVKQVVNAAQGEVITVPGGERYQLAILRRADEMFERLRKKQPDHRRVEFESARNLQHIGTQLGKLGDGAGAEQSFRRAIERLAPWSGPDFDYLRGSVWRSLGMALDRRGARAEALVALQHARCLLEEAATRIPGDRVVRRQFAEAIAALANAQDRTDPSATLALLTRAQAEKAALLAEDPGDLAGALAFALGCNHLADQLDAQDPHAAEEHATRGLDALARFAPIGPEEATLRARLAGLYDARGRIRAADRRADQAEQDHGCALALRAWLARDFPAIQQYGYEVGCSLCNLGMVAAARDDLAGAARLWDESLERLRNAVRAEPKRVEYARTLATVLANRANAALDLDQPDELARLLPELAAASAPTNALLAARLAIRCATAVRARRGPDAATAWFERAIDCIEAAAARGFRDRAHFESSRSAAAYDPIRDQPRFLDALDAMSAKR